ncbi:hypothetical protein LTR33_013009, partial [Friedmanniomyces endolithicus]
WVPALGTLNAGAHSDIPHDDASGWSPANSPVITIFAHTWKNPTYIRCAQGWLPSLTGLRDTDRSLAPDFGALLARQAHHFPAPLSSDLYEVDKRRGQMWLDIEQKLIATGHRINNIRRARSYKPVTMDFGWCQRAAREWANARERAKTWIEILTLPVVLWRSSRFSKRCLQAASKPHQYEPQANE